MPGTASTLTAPRSERSFSYRPGLDGMRAIAVLAVMGYHGHVGWLKGGFLGVDIFFVLSGFLITSLLVNELTRNDRIDLLSFWMRRARRLLPALALVLIAVAIYAQWSAPAPALNGIRHDGLTSLAFVTNWRYAWNLGSYFEQFNLYASPLRHTWSLAIEEQFYVVWPLVLFSVWRLARKRRDRVSVLMKLAFGAATLSAAWMVVLYAITRDRSRVYFGTDTRAQGVLIGSALALYAIKYTLPKLRFGVVVVAAAALIAALVFVADSATWMYLGGFTVVSLAAMVVISAAAQPDGRVVALLSYKPLVAIGRISYGLYLWHWPIYVFLGTRPLLVKVAVTFVVSILSYVVVEQRARFVRIPRAAFVTAIAVVPVALASVLVGATNDALSLDMARVAQAQQTITSPMNPRISLIGDSSIFTLYYYGAVTLRREINVNMWAPFGCGLLNAEQRNSDPPSADCKNSPTQWSTSVQQFDPDVFTLEFGPWDVREQHVAGHDIKPGEAMFARVYTSALDQLRAITHARGAQLVLLDAPCIPQANTRSIAAFNRMLADYQRRHADDVSIVDWNTYLCNGRTSLRPDGVHFTAQSAPIVAAWLAPQLHTIGLRARAARADHTP